MVKIKVMSEMIYTLDGLTKEDIRLIHWSLELLDNSIDPELIVKKTNIMDAIEELNELK